MSPFPPKPRSALLIVGHGSTHSPDASEPTFLQAREIRRRRLFAEVHCAFWKEEPSLRMVGYAIEAGEVYVVPHFISEGYFTRQIIPRELELTGPTTAVRGRVWHSCDPVGIHPRMTDLLLRRARETAPQVDPARTALIIVGHGTAQNAQSAVAIRSQVERLKQAGAPYREICDAYLEEEPRLADWEQWCESPQVIVLPFFIADGLHGSRDIPFHVGVTPERSGLEGGPYRVRGRAVYCSRAIGADLAVADMILDQVQAFDARHNRGGSANA